MPILDGVVLINVVWPHPFRPEKGLNMASQCGSRGPFYVVFPILILIVLYLVYDSIVNPQEFVTASMTGLD